MNQSSRYIHDLISEYSTYFGCSHLTLLRTMENKYTSHASPIEQNIEPRLFLQYLTTLTKQDIREHALPVQLLNDLSEKHYEKI